MNRHRQSYGSAMTVLLVLCGVGHSLCAGETPPSNPPKTGAPSIQIDEQTVVTRRHRFVLAPSGLPAQVNIRPAPYELPLEIQGKKETPNTELLKTIGRGPQLRKPLRLEAKIGGEAKALEVSKPATPALAGETVTATSTCTFGSLSVELTCTYGPLGDMALSIAYSSGGQEVESLELVADLEGAFDTLVVGAPVADKVQVYPAATFEIPVEKGMAWGNAVKDSKHAGRAAPGVPSHVFVGNGDRGFTMLSDGDTGWQIDPLLSSVVLERDAAQKLTMRVRIINKPSKVAEKVVAQFQLLVHPSAFRAKEARKEAWLSWPYEGKHGMQLPCTVNSRSTLQAKKPGLVRADTATLSDGLAQASVLEGPAGGAAISAEQDLSATYPIGLFRYLAGTHNALTTRLETNSVDFLRAGSSARSDRVAIGRALIHDIGVGARGLAHLHEAAHVVEALNKYGFFADNEMQVIPYWRSKAVAQFGETYEEGGAFELTKDDPNAQVYVTIYRRKRMEGKRAKGVTTLIVVMNESNQDLRNRLNILNPKAVFGGPNRLSIPQVRKTYDYSKLPAAADWKATQHADGGKRAGAVLKDVEDGGVVAQQATKVKGIEIYGPLHVPAHSFRLLWAYSPGR